MSSTKLLMSTLPNKYLRSAYDRITGLNTRFRIMTGKVSMINQDQTCDEHLENSGCRYWPTTGTVLQIPCSAIWSWPAIRLKA